MQEEGGKNVGFKKGECERKENYEAMVMEEKT